jgi:hypothetical protein
LGRRRTETHRTQIRVLTAEFRPRTPTKPPSAPNWPGDPTTRNRWRRSFGWRRKRPRRRGPIWPPPVTCAHSACRWRGVANTGFRSASTPPWTGPNWAIASVNPAVPGQRGQRARRLGGVGSPSSGAGAHAARATGLPTCARSS